MFSRRRRLLAVALSLSVLGFCQRLSASPQEVLWVDMDAAPKYFESDGFLNALRLRLPGYQVVLLSPDSLPRPCEESPSTEYIARVTANPQGEAAIAIRSCALSEEILRETIPRALETEDGYRRGAVLAGMALDTARGTTSDPEPEAIEEEPFPSRGPMKRTRPVGTISGAPGMTVVPANDKVVFSGIFEGGVLFTNGLWPKLGARLSTRMNGVSGKGDEATLLDRSFWLGLGYRFEVDDRWFLTPGLSFDYCHPEVKITSDAASELDESLKSRFGLRASIQAGYHLWEFLAVFAELKANVSFDERQYITRGRDVLDLGLVLLDLTLGVQVFI